MYSAIGKTALLLKSCTTTVGASTLLDARCHCSFHPSRPCRFPTRLWVVRRRCERRYARKGRERQFQYHSRAAAHPVEWTDVRADRPTSTRSNHEQTLNPVLSPAAPLHYKIRLTYRHSSTSIASLYGDYLFCIKPVLVNSLFNPEKSGICCMYVPSGIALRRNKHAESVRLSSAAASGLGSTLSLATMFHIFPLSFSYVD